MIPNPGGWRKENNMDKLSSVIRNLLEAIYSTAVLLSPVLITISPEIISSLNGEKASKDIKSLNSMKNLKSGELLKELGILFPKLEKVKTEAAPAPAKKETETEGLIEIGDFGKVDIRVALVIEAEKVDGSDKLLYLTVDSGSDRRQIVAGIAQAYSPEDIKGKKILLVSNLKPAVIFGRNLAVCFLLKRAVKINRR